VTTGTGSGKSLSFFIPIIDRIIKAKTEGVKARTRAIVIYPMNAWQTVNWKNSISSSMATGQMNAHSPSHATPARKKVERDAIADNPPDILLTNFMMLEYILTASMMWIARWWTIARASSGAG
jgi:ATP-dependent helicase YprA (DUF1998 family)